MESLGELIWHREGKLPPHSGLHTPSAKPGLLLLDLFAWHDLWDVLLKRLPLCAIIFTNK